MKKGCKDLCLWSTTPEQRKPYNNRWKWVICYKRRNNLKSKKFKKNDPRNGSFKHQLQQNIFCENSNKIELNKRLVPRDYDSMPTFYFVTLRLSEYFS